VAPKKTEREWLDGHFKALTETAGRVAQIHPEVVEDAPPWSLLKHATIRDTLGMYLTIMKNQSWLKYKVFIDTNSSCGISRLRDRKQLLAGSALLGATTQTPFDHYHFCEPDDVKRAALEARLSAVLLKPKFTVYAENADDAIPKIMRTIPPRDAHFFAVVDPYNLGSVSWKGLSALMGRTRGDVLFNFQTTQVKRVTAEGAETFWGNKDVHELRARNAPEPEILDAFVTRLQTLRPVTEVFRVRDGQTRYYYDFIYAVAATSGQNPWMKHAARLRERLDGLTGQDVLNALRSPSLDRFGI
jgi:three-Cys-motif partner protein